MFCERSIWFIHDRDQTDRFRFCSSSSPRGQELNHLIFPEGNRPDSMILVEGDQFFIRSEAILRIVRHLGWPWKCFLAGWFVPTFLRDWGYACFAGIRKYVRWKSSACRIPDAKFLAKVIS